MQTKQATQKQTKKRNPNRANRTKPVIRAKSNGQVVMKLPDCSLHYAAVLANPFEAPAGACIPSELFPLPSGKSRWTQKGKFNLGTTGVGFIGFNPCTVTGVGCITFTQSTSVGTTNTALSSFTNLGSSIIQAIPYTNAQLTALTLQARIVGYGLRVMYIGPLQNANGEVYSYEEPDHNDISGLTPATIEAKIQCSRMKVASGLNDYVGEVFYSGPVQPSDVEFLPQAQPLNTTASSLICGCIIEGIASDQYDYEVVVHLEHIGNSSASRTMSHSEPTFTGKAIEAAKTVSENRPLSSQTAPVVKSTFIDSVRSLLPTIVQGGRVLSKVVTGDFMGAALGAADMVVKSQNSALNPYLAMAHGYGDKQLVLKDGFQPDRGSGPSFSQMFGLG